MPDGRIGFWTSSKSGKAKRLRNNPRVTVVPCNNHGKVADGSLLVAGTAHLVSGGPEFDEIRSKVNAKYGVMVPISKSFNTLGHIGNGPFPYGDTGVIISVDA
ncbi:pyridoxamine 5'-phosphate oxidase family protein [Rhodococcus erythropolis]|uniref:pyridoxamine 5'-phosphate oxidase family protein n=1 Tax=Rhodococcus erythropolis TaxID=1833 RepID=UPI000696B743|nr:pyridoxamine 5'-phosphate oxidase family protein [Rhodococcus erythropolis]